MDCPIFRLEVFPDRPSGYMVVLFDGGAAWEVSGSIRTKREANVTANRIRKLFRGAMKERHHHGERIADMLKTLLARSDALTR